MYIRRTSKHGSFLKMKPFTSPTQLQGHLILDQTRHYTFSTSKIKGPWQMIRNYGYNLDMNEHTALLLPPALFHGMWAGWVYHTPATRHDAAEGPADKPPTNYYHPMWLWNPRMRVVAEVYCAPAVLQALHRLAGTSCHLLPPASCRGSRSISLPKASCPTCLSQPPLCSQWAVGILTVQVES